MSWPEEWDLDLCHKDTALFPMESISAAWNLIKEVLPGAGTHSIRRGALQELAISGADWSVIQKTARHVFEQTTRLYMDGLMTPDSLATRTGSELLARYGNRLNRASQE